MVKDGSPIRQDVDPKSGFEVVWRSGDESLHAKYSLVRVPIGAPVLLAYQKPRVGIDIDLLPVDPSHWRVRGILDPDTIANLKFEVARQRDGKVPPAVEQADLDRIKGFGQVVEIPGWQRLFGMDLIVPTANIINFLYKVWRPIAHTKKVDRMVPGYYLGENGGHHMLLPQKEINEDGVRHRVTLEVRRAV
jgi:hypothetical protein